MQATLQNKKQLEQQFAATMREQDVKRNQKMAEFGKRRQERLEQIKSEFRQTNN